MQNPCFPPARRRCGAIRRIASCLLTGLALGLAPDATGMAQAMPAEQPSARYRFAPHIAEASQRFGIPERWIGAVLRAESAADVRAVSSAGAMGLMQVMPETWAGQRARHGLGRDPYDSRDNILAGTAYLREMFDRYGNIPAMLAAYNAGPARYDEHVATARPLPAETRAYVALLAPTLGTELPSAAMTSAPRPLPDWREAPLFVAPASEFHRAASPPSDRISRDARSAVPAPADRAIETRADGIFLVRNVPGERR